MAWFNKPMQVVGFLATRRGDEDRGPMVRIRSEDAAMRQLVEGELAWVHGPRRQELAQVLIDDTLPRGAVVLRDVAGIAISEIVRVSRPELDPPTRPPVP
jgi:anaerobic selenocysteine-containing dehydrogenase